MDDVKDAKDILKQIREMLEMLEVAADLLKLDGIPTSATTISEFGEAA